MEPPTLERLLSLLLVVEVALHDHVTVHDDLAYRLAVERHIVHIFVHDPHQVRGDVALTLAREKLRVLLAWQLLPLPARGARGHGAVSLGQAVEVYRPYIQVQEVAEQVGRWHVAGDASGDLLVEFAGTLVVGERYLDGWCRAVMGDLLGLEELPDPARLDLSQAYVGPRDRGHRPREGPAVAVEHRQRPQVSGLVVHLRLDDVAQGADVRPAVAVHHALGLTRRPGGVVD